MSPAENVINLNLKEQTDALLKTLTLREERVIKMRFGIGDGSEHTLEEARAPRSPASASASSRRRRSASSAHQPQPQAEGLPGGQPDLILFWGVLASHPSGSPLSTRE